MADKQQTITVNYKFNTVDVDRAQQLLSRANQASNQLQQSGQKAGQGISQGFNQATRSITSMEVELARVKTQLEVANDPTKVAALSAQYKNLAIQIRAARQELMGIPAANKKVESSTKSLGQSFGGLLSTVKAVFTAGIIREVFTTAMAMAELAGNVEGVERAFNNRFANGAVVLGKLRTATHGAITDFELMQRTLQATNLGVSIEQFPRLLEFATARAQQTGLSVDYLVNSIVNGIGHKSPRILDNLGIAAERLKEKFKGAAVESQSIAAVTQAVGEIIEEEMSKSGSYIETSATKVKQLNVAWENLRLTLSKSVTSGGVIDFLTGGVKILDEGVKVATGGINRLTEIHMEGINSAASSRAALVLESKAYKDLGKDVNAKIEFLKKEITETRRMGVVRKAELRQTEESIETTKKKLYAESAIGLQTGKSIRDTEKATSSLNEQVKAQTKSYEIILATIPILKEYIKELENLTPDKPDPSGIISRKQKEIELLQEEIKYTNDLSKLTHTVTDAQGNQTQVVGTLIQKLAILQAELGDLQRDFSGIDIKPLKIQVKDAADGLLEFEANTKRMEVAMQDLQNGAFGFNLEVNKPEQTVAQLDTFWTNMQDMWNENWRELTAASVDFQTNAINSWLEAEAQSLQNQLANVRSFYQTQQELAGDNARARSELRVREDRETRKLQQDIFEREKRIRRAQAAIDGAGAVIKAFVTAPNVYVAIAQAALIAATTVAQLKAIDKEQPRFAEGVINLQGPGTGTSDSIPARLSKGESVMTAWETKYAGDVLKDVRAKKLDNKSLRELKQGRGAITSQQFDDSRIVKAIKDSRPPDYVEQAGIAYRVTTSSEGYRRKQRSKSIHI